jgi:hypothetical protein
VVTCGLSGIVSRMASQAFTNIVTATLLGEEGQNTMSKEFKVINLSDVVKSRRGAVAQYDDGLLAALTTLTKGDAIFAEPLAIDVGSYDTDEALLNAKQNVAQNVRKHVRHLVSTKAVTWTRIKLDWDMITGVPQISIKE